MGKFCLGLQGIVLQHLECHGTYDIFSSMRVPKTERNLPCCHPDFSIHQNNLKLQPLGLPGHPHSTQLGPPGFQQPQSDRISRESRVRKFQWQPATLSLDPK
jgi:hypothetical protein